MRGLRPSPRAHTLHASKPARAGFGQEQSLAANALITLSGRCPTKWRSHSRTMEKTNISPSWVAIVSMAVGAAMALSEPASGQEVNELPPVRYVDGAPACPSDTDIKNIDTRLSSRISSPSNESTVRAERQRAVTCRMAGQRYTPADWERMTAVIRGDI